MTTEPIVISWAGGEISVGYLGGKRYRVASESSVIEAKDAQGAAAAVLEEVFRGVAPGEEAAKRSPIRIQLVDGMCRLTADPRMFNGWTHESARMRGDVGSHDTLYPFLAELLAADAERSWANGVTPVRPTPLGADFSYDAFLTAPDREGLCRRLAAVLTARMHASASASVSLAAAITELQGLGHDLWSWDVGVWGADYVTPRSGAGLLVTHVCSDDDADEDVVEVEFRG